MHHFSIVQIALWFLEGVWQWIRYEVPDWIIRPKTVSRSPPSWWTSVKSWHDWYYCVGSDGYPLACWFTHYIEACWLLLARWVDEAADYARDWALDTVRYWLGYSHAAFGNFSDWISFIAGIVGWSIPWWAYDLGDAANRLYSWLPASIRGDYETWEQLWEGIKQSVREWVQIRYDAFRAWALDAWQWVVLTGNNLKAWWDDAHAWLDWFRQNATAAVREFLAPYWDWVVWFFADPRGAIITLLGDAWAALDTFARDALPFFYNLWGTYAEMIGEFWSNPLGFLYDRVEDFLSDKW